MANAFTRFFAKVGAALSAFLHGPGGKILADAAASIVNEVGTVAASVLLEEAKKRVGALENVPGPGEQKFANAQDYLTQYAARVGIEASKSLIDFTISAALRSLRSQTPAS